MLGFTVKYINIICACVFLWVPYACSHSIRVDKVGIIRNRFDNELAIINIYNHEFNIHYKWFKHDGIDNVKVQFSYKDKTASDCFGNAISTWEQRAGIIVKENGLILEVPFFDDMPYYDNESHKYMMDIPYVLHE